MRYIRLSRFHKKGTESHMNGVGTPRLSRREGEVLQLACQGLSDKEIASRLGIGCVTVQTYVGRLMIKLGAANRTQLGNLAPPPAI